jgi:hypothetical protein
MAIIINDLNINSDDFIYPNNIPLYFNDIISVGEQIPSSSVISGKKYKIAVPDSTQAALTTIPEEFITPGYVEFTAITDGNSGISGHVYQLTPRIYLNTLNPKTILSSRNNSESNLLEKKSFPIYIGGQQIELLNPNSFIAPIQRAFYTTETSETFDISNLKANENNTLGQKAVILLQAGGGGAAQYGGWSGLGCLVFINNINDGWNIVIDGSNLYSGVGGDSPKRGQKIILKRNDINMIICDGGQYGVTSIISPEPTITATNFTAQYGTLFDIGTHFSGGWTSRTPFNTVGPSIDITEVFSRSGDFLNSFGRFYSGKTGWDFLKFIDNTSSSRWGENERTSRTGDNYRQNGGASPFWGNLTLGANAILGAGGNYGSPNGGNGGRAFAVVYF